MPALSTLLRHVFGTDSVLSECRNCGTTVERDAERCPECGAADIATYHLST